MSQVTAITVAFGSFGVIPEMVRSLPAGLPLVIVDNGPDDGLRAWAAEAGIEVRVPGANLGFGRGCNLGAEGVTTDFLLFINPDARLEPGALDALLDAAGRHPEAAAFGPLLVHEDGRPRYKRNSYLLPGAKKPPRDPGPEDREVGVLSGAVLLVRRAAFEAVGGFDPEIFLYFEDDDLSLRLRSGWGPVFVVPGARAFHTNGKGSAPSAATSRWKGYQWARARVHVGRKHGLPLPLMGALWDGVSHLVSPKSWNGAEHRNEALGRIQGALSMVRNPAV